ncbi:phosphotransferase family protein [Fundicoccus culcitae]|uniref:Phosphotransferase family protein n=1 Tax=Fundicoccus culcitae TaxID=2969821 RepID=A0ABY5P6V0_9LACT|nr:phosphotransferase family protein [Fundicoccus culcitae]UUX34158.1 phosphotransferase family protein [Fundicoccus culcitae]
MVENDEQWDMRPILGATGQAFMGVKEEEKIFFKRNSSPLIAALAADGITPKLKWTQRTYSGDILTAQEWAEGKTLSKQDMSSQRVIDLIRHVHESNNLLLTLKRIDNRVCKPLDFIDLYFNELPPSLKTHTLFNEIIQFLEDQIDDDFYLVDYVVCHGDLNHHNFLLSNHEQLYLVDWENVRIADPISDITWLLCQYLEPSQWMEWFNNYGIEITKKVFKRVQWYSLMNCLLLVKHYASENRYARMNEVILLIKSIYNQVK